MAAQWFARTVDEIQPRYVGMAVQLGLGASTILTPATLGTTYAYIQSRSPLAPNITSAVIGLIFIVTAVVMGATDNRWVYWLFGVSPFLLFGIIAFWAAITTDVVSFQAGVLYLGIGTYNFLSHPRNEKVNNAHHT